MDSVEITLKISKGLENAVEQGYNRLYVNVDNLDDGNGFIRVLAMNGPYDIIVYEGTFPLDICYDVLFLLEQSEYQIKDFTTMR